MKLIKPNANAVGKDQPSDGVSGIPSWRRVWIENQVRWVELECDCIEDLSIQVLTFINSFEGSSIDCVKHGRFVKVKRTIKRRPPVKSSDVPLF